MDINKLFGGTTAAKCLLFIAKYEESTAGEISESFEISKPQVFAQLNKLEESDVLSSRKIGNIKLFSLNPRSGIRTELKVLLEKYIEEHMPRSENSKFFLIRRRTRAKGKALGGVYDKSNK